MRNQIFSSGFWKRPQAVLCSLALASALGGVGYASATHLEHIHALALKLASPEEGPSQTGFAPVVRKVLPAVVNISSSKIAKVPTEFQQMTQFPCSANFSATVSRTNSSKAPTIIRTMARATAREIARSAIPSSATASSAGNVKSPSSARPASAPA